MPGLSALPEPVPPVASFYIVAPVDMAADTSLTRPALPDTNRIRPVLPDTSGVPAPPALPEPIMTPEAPDTTTSPDTTASPDTIASPQGPEVPDTTSPDTTVTPGFDPGDLMLRPQQEETPEIVEIWSAARSPARTIAETDSTLRWFLALNLADRLYRKPGVITYRTGRLGQPTGMDIYSHEKRHQRLMLNEMEVTDPVTGQINWNRLPIHKVEFIEEASRSWIHRSEVRLHEHYTVQPRTFLNFDEGSGNYRNLEFSFTHNLTPRANLELSFWDRRDGDLYPRNTLEGRQIVSKFRFHLSDRLLLKAGYINNGLDQEQPFGYAVPDLHLYHFNPYRAVAMEPSARSNHTTNDLWLQLFRRPAKEPDPGSEGASATRLIGSERRTYRTVAEGEERTPRQALGLHYRTEKRELTWSSDTTSTSIRDLGAFAWQDLAVGRSDFRLRGDLRLLHDQNGRSLTRDTWTDGALSLLSRLPLVPWLEGWVDGRIEGRSDSRSGYQASAGLLLTPPGPLTLELFGGTGSVIPDLQPLYWNSRDYRGNPDLENESGRFGGALASMPIGRWLTLGARIDGREVKQGIFVAPDGVFVNADPYWNKSAASWLQLDSPRFEGEVSATMQQFDTASGHPVNTRLREGGERIWFKGELYWKNYIFNRAAYIKTGVSGIFSPGEYTPADYLVPLGRWQHGGASRHLPSFHRLDFDLSARIRWFMLLIRYENILDGVQQLGYFEADGYPMPHRRFLIGFRIVFTN